MTRVLRNLRTTDAQGRRIMGTPWRGYLGSQIPSGSAIYGDLNLPADANNDYVLKLTAWPSSGTLFLKEDGSPIFTPVADGSYTATATLVENGIALSPPETLTFNSGAVGTITTTPGNNTAAGVHATVLQGQTINAGVGNSTASGVAATVVTSGATVISTTPGNNTAAGVQATINTAAGAGTVISTTPGNSTASGVSAVIAATTSGGVGNSQVTVPAIRTARFVAHSRVAVFNTTSPILLTKGALDELYFVGDFTKDLNDGATTAVSVVPVSAGVTVLESPTLQGALGVVKLGALDTSGGPNYFTWRVTCANSEQFDRTITLIVVDDRTWMFGKDPDDRRFWTFDIGADLALSGNTTITSVQSPVVTGVSSLATPSIQGNLTIVKIGGLDATVTNSCQMTFLFATGEKITRAIYFKEEDH